MWVEQKRGTRELFCSAFLLRLESRGASCSSSTGPVGLTACQGLSGTSDQVAIGAHGAELDLGPQSAAGIPVVPERLQAPLGTGGSPRDDAT